MFIMIIQENFPRKRLMLFQIDRNSEHCRKKKSISRNPIENIRMPVMIRCCKYLWAAGEEANTNDNGAMMGIALEFSTS